MRADVATQSQRHEGNPTIRLLRGFVSSWPVFVVVAGMALSGAGCSKKISAKTTPDVPGLAAPEPPPRVLAPVEPNLPSVAPTPETPRAPARAPSRPAQRPEPRATTPAPEPPKPEEAAPAPPPANPEPPRMLQTSPPAREDEAARHVRDVIGRASADLARVNLASLSRDERAQYDAARRFVQQAEDALKARNIVFAGTLAEKAATLAAVLLGR